MPTNSVSHKPTETNNYSTKPKGRLSIVGLGPGKREYFTLKAIQTIENSEVVVGYKGYLSIIKELISGKKIIASGMKQEIDRCREAISIATEGHWVTLISSGDAGIYGMAGPAIETLIKTELNEEIEIEIIPGLTAASAAAAILGAPLMNDFAVISLSDLLTPWEVIQKRLKAVAEADLVTAIYNPKSQKRTCQIKEAQDIFLNSRPKITPVGIVQNALRDGEQKIITTLGDFTQEEINMFSLVIIGNSQTYIQQGKMITRRGYYALR